MKKTMYSKNDGGETKYAVQSNKKKNIQRLGGSTGLSLEAFANAKSRNNAYNPALLKKKREFYKNAKHVSKYKKILKQQNQHNDESSSVRPIQVNEFESVGEMRKEDKKNRKGSYSLQKLYEKKHEEQEKARIERECIIKAKKEERERAMSHRKDLREKMFKKTRKGQPVMKYRIEHILETLQNSTS
ncbi:uncharacterized protein LOC130812666 [Amaranthus tricolor]|uniref:uncharacterized protein LOC130812666 n=1 Tax=Amaranthus tricolor TaxID=29722 RepID=UPI002583727F|nr:uncharacterized protein LOC130812666 [Amaranthus tricolor]